MSKNKSSSENSPDVKKNLDTKSDPATEDSPGAKASASVKDTKGSGNAEVANKKASHKKTPADSKVVKTADAIKNPVKSTRSSKIPLITGSILLVVIAVAISGFYFLWQQFLQQQSQYQETQSQLIATLTSDIEQYSQGQNQLRSELKNMIRNETGGIKRTVIHLQELAGKNHEDWALSETEYLLRIANHRLQLEGDIQTATKALMIADSKLQALADPSLLPVRKHLADEISALQSTRQPDIHGMVLILDSLQTKSVQMQLKVAILPEPIADTKTTNDFGEISFKNWRPALDRVWKELKTLVVIKKHDKQLIPILTIEQQQTIRHILQLKIQGIRVALLSKQSEIFSLSIQETLQWLEEHFSPDDSNVALLKSRLQEFSTIPLKINLPEIGRSLHVLQAIQKHRKTSPIPAIQPEKSSDAANTATQKAPEKI